MSQDFRKLPLHVLRQMWSKAWGLKPHAHIGRKMLEVSLEHKIREQEGDLRLTRDQRDRLTQLIKEYNCSSSSFQTGTRLKHGTRLVRMHAGKKHSVLVKPNGFEYADKTYTSLSKIAYDITGKSWNGWVFFGLKKAGPK